jgi:hypothetical protein
MDIDHREGADGCGPKDYKYERGKYSKEEVIKSTSNNKSLGFDMRAKRLQVADLY